MLSLSEGVQDFSSDFSRESAIELAQNGLNNFALFPTTSGRLAEFATVTGVPHAKASIGGSPNPSYGQQISTGLCACVTFEDGIEVNGNEVTFTINIVDNEPIRGIELDIHHDFSELTYESVSRGEKLQGLVNDEGNPTSDMTILGNAIDSHVKVLASTFT